MFIDDHRGEYGVEAICRALPIAPSTYHHHQAVARDPSKACPRRQRDAGLAPKVKAAWEASGKTRFASQLDVSNPAGIIILGGGEDARVMSVTGLPEVNDAADRFLAGLALARVYPGARLIFTGGSGSLLGQSYSGADVALRLVLE